MRRGLAAKRQAVKFAAAPQTCTQDKNEYISRILNEQFASGKTEILPAANGAFADCKLFICRRQNSCPINGKFIASGKPVVIATFLFDLPLTHFVLTALTEAAMY